jgi:hypothetical protein
MNDFLKFLATGQKHEFLSSHQQRLITHMRCHQILMYDPSALLTSFLNVTTTAVETAPFNSFRWGYC